MKRLHNGLLLSLLVCFVMLAACERQSTIYMQAQLQSLVDAERAFAQLSVEQGIKESFLANLAEGAIVFRPRPVDGRQAYGERAPADDVLSWQPVVAGIAASGDFGFTTGPWEYRGSAGQAEADVYGQYISVWRKRADGPWRVAIDIGTDNAKPQGEAPAIELLMPRETTRSIEDGEAKRRSLARADKQFGEELTRRQYAAYTDYATEDIRWYRSGGFPQRGRDRAAQINRGRVLGATPVGTDAAISGDLGYSYGMLRVRTLDNGADVNTDYSYMRLWRLQRNGEWRVFLDVLIPAGAATEENGE
jgi:ketosteroid isomerase-like protein